MLQTIYVLNKEILQFLGLKSAVYNQERVIMARVRYMACCFAYHYMLARRESRQFPAVFVSPIDFCCFSTVQSTIFYLKKELISSWHPITKSNFSNLNYRYFLIKCTYSIWFEFLKLRNSRNSFYWPKKDQTKCEI